MGWADRITEYLDASVFVPAIAQGILGLECRADDSFVVGLLGELTDEQSRIAADTERSLMRALNGSCQVPLAGHAVIQEAAGTVQITLRGLVADWTGQQVLVVEQTGSNPVPLGQSVAQALLEQGAADIIKAASAQ